MNKKTRAAASVAVTALAVLAARYDIVLDQNIQAALAGLIAVVLNGWLAGTNAKEKPNG